MTKKMPLKTDLPGNPLDTALCICLYMTVFLLSLLFVTGCGKKDWPEPAVQEDRFDWKTVQGHREGNCLDIKASVQGNADNLDTIILELEGAKEICQDCPFSPTKRRVFPITSPEVEKKGSDIRIYCCPFQEDREYRWRLRGVNAFYAIKDVISDIQTSK